MDPRERFSSLEEGVRAAVLGIRAQMWTALPGILVSYDAATAKAQVQPAVKSVRRKQDGSLEYMTIPVLPDVPVHFPHGGGYTLTLPLAAGDEVLLVFSARNIDGWWDQGDVQQPGDRRMHDLSDAFCIPGPMSRPKVIADISENTAQLRSDDGEMFLELDTPNNRMRMRLDDLEVILDKGEGAVTVKAPTKIVLDSPLVEVTGEIKADGEIAAKVDTDNIHLTTHVHSGVANGPSNTNDPVNGS